MITFSVFGVSLGALHLAYPLPYVYRVLVYQDADFSDIHNFPASSIAAWRRPTSARCAR